MQRPFPIQFPHGQPAQAIKIATPREIPQAIEALGLPTHRPVLVVIGGAKLLKEEDFARLQRLFIEVLAPLAESIGAVVADGGTDTGVMRLMGKARQTIAGSFPLVGVCPSELVQLPDQTNPNPESASLEPHHTQFVLPQGNQWGDESACLAQLASEIASGQPTAAVLVNGGPIALVDAQENVAVGRPLVVIAGTGRLADEIAQAMQDPQPNPSPAIAALVQNNPVKIVDLASPLSELEQLLKQLLVQP